MIALIIPQLGPNERIRLLQGQIDEIGQPPLFALNPPSDAGIVTLVFHLERDLSLIAIQQVPGAARHVAFNLFKVVADRQDAIAGTEIATAFAARGLTVVVVVVRGEWWTGQMQYRTIRRARRCRGQKCRLVILLCLGSSRRRIRLLLLLLRKETIVQTDQFGPRHATNFVYRSVRVEL